MTAREYHDRTAHSPASVRTSGHTLEWDIKPFPFKIYTDLGAQALPRELDSIATDTLAALADPAPTASAFGLSELVAVLYYAAGVTKKKTYPGGGEVLKPPRRSPRRRLHWPQPFHDRNQALVPMCERWWRGQVVRAA